MDVPANSGPGFREVFNLRLLFSILLRPTHGFFSKLQRNFPENVTIFPCS